jgi:hypothetical protein
VRFSTNVQKTSKGFVTRASYRTGRVSDFHRRKYRTIIPCHLTFIGKFSSTIVCIFNDHNGCVGESADPLVVNDDVFTTKLRSFSRKHADASVTRGILVVVTSPLL